nr:acyl-CoA dehydrogenase family protein [Sphingopyxis sp. BSNA05]
MKLGHDTALQAFREKIRSYFQQDYPQDILAKVASGASLTTAEVRRAEMALGERGWLASAWPEEYGGPGWSIEEQYILTRNWSGPVRRRSRQWVSSMSVR